MISYYVFQGIRNENFMKLIGNCEEESVKNLAIFRFRDYCKIPQSAHEWRLIMLEDLILSNHHFWSLIKN